MAEIGEIPYCAHRIIFDSSFVIQFWVVRFKMKFQRYGGRVQEGRRGKVKITLGSTELSRRGWCATAVVSVAMVLVLGVLGWAAPPRALAPELVVGSPRAPGVRRRRNAPILRRAESAGHASHGTPVYAMSAQHLALHIETAVPRGAAPARHVAPACGQRDRAEDFDADQTDCDGEPPPQASTHRHEGSRIYVTHLHVAPAKNVEQLAETVRGPPAVEMSTRLHFSPASQGLAAISADLPADTPSRPSSRSLSTRAHLRLPVSHGDQRGHARSMRLRRLLPLWATCGVASPPSSHLAPCALASFAEATEVRGPAGGRASVCPSACGSREVEVSGETERRIRSAEGSSRRWDGGRRPILRRFVKLGLYAAAPRQWQWVARFPQGFRLWPWR